MGVGAPTILASLLKGTVGGALGSRKGGAEQAFGGGRRAGGSGASKPAAATQRRGLRDLRATIKPVEGPTADLDLGDDDSEFTPYDLQAAYDAL